MDLFEIMLRTHVAFLYRKIQHKKFIVEIKDLTEKKGIHSTTTTKKDKLKHNLE